MSFPNVRAKAKPGSVDSVASEGTLANYLAKAFGAKGFDRFKSGSTATDGNWYTIVALTDSVVSVEGTGIADGASMSLAPGASFSGPITKITRASGDFIAYLA